MSLQTNLKGKRILVTGTGRGIGKAIVERLYEYGAIVFALSRNPQHLENLKQQCPDITTIVVNLEDWNASREAVESIGRVDFLVNNAAVYIHQEFFDIKPESFDKIIATNLKAVINVSQVIAKKMIESGRGGSIVNISSPGSQRQNPGAAVYCASKAALESLTRSMAIELGKHKIRVNAVSPGAYETDMHVKDVLGGMGITKEQAVEFFDPKMPLGQCLAVDGGFLCM